MDLIINTAGAGRYSLGVRRLFSGVMQFLDWPSEVSLTKASRFSIAERTIELVRPGRRDAIFWSPTHRGPLKAHHHVVSVHDCINVEYVYRVDWRLPMFRRLFQLVLNNAETIVALSHATRNAILRNYTVAEQKLTVIPPGFDFPTISPGTPPSGAGQPKNPFVLMLTNPYLHKNALNALRAFAASRAANNHITLRVLGSLSPGVLAQVARPGVQIEIHSHVDDTTLTQWYRSCMFLFSPSLAEGYNLPISEAVTLGSNVLCSDIDVHREFFGKYANFFDPASVEDMTDALNKAFDNPGPWHAALDHTTARSYRDVAADYRRVFQSIEQRRL
jgi:glycosyltransferase involved in cell wall biosynthesis